VLRVSDLCFVCAYFVCMLLCKCALAVSPLSGRGSFTLNSHSLTALRASNALPLVFPRRKTALLQHCTARTDEGVCILCENRRGLP
jgi:hypothetical protein